MCYWFCKQKGVIERSWGLAPCDRKEFLWQQKVGRGHWRRCTFRYRGDPRIERNRTNKLRLFHVVLTWGPEDARGGPVLVYFLMLGWTLTKKQLGELKFYVIFPVLWQSISVIHGRNLEPRIKAETLNENFPLANSLWFAQHNFNSEVSLLRDGLVTAGWAGLHQSAVRTVLQTLATQAILVFVELMEIIQHRTPDVRCNLSCSGPQQTGSSGPWNDH